MKVTALFLATLVAMQSLASSAQAFFGERTQSSITRNAGSGLELATQLTKYEYRYVERVERYIEQVPYYVEVPYEEEETYYTHETRCENVPRDHQVCSTERKCESVPRTECTEQERCHSALAVDHEFDSLVTTVAARDRRVPGHKRPSDGSKDRGSHGRPDRGGGRGNGGGHSNGGGSSGGGGGHSHGGGNSGGGGSSSGPTCNTVRVCRTYHETECRNEQVCRTETRYEQECRSVAIPHTRIVTKYRTETHYRTEERERVVTDAVFDHSWTTDVVIEMPAESQLIDGEQESVIVTLRGSETAPDVDVAVDSPVFNYHVLDKQRNGAAIRVKLGLVARYSPEQLGRSTVSGLKLVKHPGGSFSINFTDVGVVARTKTVYEAGLIDADTGEQVFGLSLEGAVGATDVAIPVNVPVADQHDHKIKLRVKREGIVLSSPVDFELEVDQVAQLDPAIYIDKNGVREFAILGAGAGAELLFTDITPNDSKVDVSYELVLKKKALDFLWKSTVAKGRFKRADLEHRGDKVIVPLRLFKGMDQKKLGSLFEKGAKVYIEAQIVRVSTRLQGHSPVKFKKEAGVKVGGGRAGH